MLDVAKRHSNKLEVRLNTLVTRLLFDAGGAAEGVEFQRGRKLYRAVEAESDASQEAGELGTLRARREVILAGGAYNTPQILMLSGIGPSAHLA